jgi:hypothetical protein
MAGSEFADDSIICVAFTGLLGQQPDSRFSALMIAAKQ